MKLEENRTIAAYYDVLDAELDMIKASIQRNNASNVAHHIKEARQALNKMATALTVHRSNAAQQP